MRIEQLTFTRFVAALLIVVFHFGSGDSYFNSEYIQFLFKQANVGVSYFFILSGFVMIIAYHKKNKINFIDYMISRFARIYPMYLIAILLLLVLSIISNKVNYLDVFLNIFMVQAWIPGKALAFNIPAWSLSVELFFYLLFPFLFNRFYSKISYNKLIIPILLFWLISQLLFHYFNYQTTFTSFFYNTYDLNFHPIFHLNEFLIGNLAGLYFVKKGNKTKNYDFHIIGLVTLVLIALKFPIGLNFHNGFLAILFVPIIILLSLNNGFLTKLFNKKGFIFLGEISYGLYILQFIVWVYVSDYRLEKYFGLDKAEDFLFCFFLRLLILIGLSVISYLYVEKPIRDKIKYYAQKRKKVIN
ncbi:acyltransferase family protein [Lacinutrix algicola]|uniref:acyltransferase family protein n=1 Tax=Lacinutrix algicola TaxID=342954 RepID=UPI0009F9FAC5|nr:acyltransferase [Lacinutrix algicola]